MKKTPLIFALLVLMMTTVLPSLANDVSSVDDSRAVDVVLALDVSLSMEDLLDSTRVRLWDVVGELSRLSPTPELRVGLLTYGTERGSAENGWVVVESDLTDDLDAIYERLMSLAIGGYEEYVGRAVQTAVDEMSWSTDYQALRVVFIAGNESTNQDAEVDFRDAAALAEASDIIVNALYAGFRENGAASGWPELARAGLGNFSSIDPKTAMTQIQAPQDEALMELNRRLNETYVPYGSRGEAGLANQRAQDENATRLGVESCSSRIVAKGTALYTNASWDLVDAAMQEDFRWSLMHDDDLPEQLRTLDEAGRTAYVNEKRQQREAIQEAIQEISEERELFLREARAARDSLGLDDAMRGVIRLQALAKGFTSRDG